MSSYAKLNTILGLHTKVYTKRGNPQFQKYLNDAVNIQTQTMFKASFSRSKLDKIFIIK